MNRADGGVTGGSPGTLQAPLAEGEHELRYVSDATDTVLARRPITVLPFAASLSGAQSAGAGTEFEVGWTGPDGSGDYVTIVKAGATAWAGESYFDTADGSPGTLVAPIEGGAHELWYVSGSDVEILVRRPVTVTPLAVTLQAPQGVKAGAQFDVAWTGPDGPGDYITIVAAGAAPGTFCPTRTPGTAARRG